MLGLALWTEPAGAQDVKTYKLTVSVHPAVRYQLKQDEVENILKGASDILQGKTGVPPHNNCKVEFKFNGFIPFPRSVHANIINVADLEEVHDVPADVKVVESITFCSRGPNPEGYAGCAWRPEPDRHRTAIVARDYFPPGLSSPRPGIVSVASVIWAHEFGHTTGLLHRYQKDGTGPSTNLMTPCILETFSQPINDDECDHFLAGPVLHYPTGLGDACPTNSSTGHPDD